MRLIPTIIEGVVASAIYDGVKIFFFTLNRVYIHLKHKVKKHQNIKALLTQAELIKEKAEQERKEGNYTAALQLFELAEKKYEHADDTNNQTDVLMKMSILENFLRINSKKARLYYKKAQIICPARNNQHIEMEMGAILSRWGEYEGACTYYDIAESICKKKGDEITQANVFRLRGIMEGVRKERNLDDAFMYLNKASELYVKLKNEPGQAKTFQAMGDVKKENAEYDSAVDYYLQAYCLFDKISDVNNRSIIMGELYKVCSLLGKEKEALEWKEKILSDNNKMPEAAKHFISSLGL